MSALKQIMDLREQESKSQAILRGQLNPYLFKYVTEMGQGWLGLARARKRTCRDSCRGWWEIRGW